MNREIVTMVIDTDAGLDDAQAIMMALSQPHVRVIGITTVHGNASAKQTCMNVLRLLKMCGRLDIPVYCGCQLSLMGSTGDSSHYHGLDGFGDQPDLDPPHPGLIRDEHSVSALVRLARQHKGVCTLVALGPLTNIAMAIRMDPAFGENLKDCFIMGGNTEAKGNITSNAEFNFHSDPEAAKVVLAELGCPITLASWELCQRAAYPWDWYGRLRTPDTKKNRFLKLLEASMVERVGQLKWPTYILCDEIAMAIAVKPIVANITNDVYVTVETGGSFTRGQMVVDWNGKLGLSTNARIVAELDREVFGELLEKARN